MDIFQKFIKYYGNLTSTNDLQIKKYLLDNWDKDEKIMDVSKHGFVSAASISRYMKKMRLSSYKEYLRQKNMSRDHYVNDIDYPILFNQLIKKKKALLDDTLDSIDHEALMESCIGAANAEMIYIVGMGYSRNQAEAMCMRLNRIGKKAVHIENIQELPFVSNHAIDNNSLCIAISQTGDTSTVNKICRHFRANDVDVIGICCEKNTELHKIGTHILQIPKIYSGMYLEAIYSEVTVSATLDFIYTYILLENYENALENYNITVKTINGKK
ncbi:MurR/RpiR family transcriptional regulator [Mollicutes bacterium LVI A0039]|nr:MurR/RpiR family transcriptional regulator [Mollicutes bacterium LVI A0039]